ncbi:SAMD9 [Mytilus edulis]|uniref:SAMD9 n=1 Tax=Mytilus edulis TaxID=6550 RepID=A0A8S3TGW2_MYTED|nr:SAMD9 [Mytilus edulis]
MKPLYQQVLYQLQSSIEEHIYANYEFLNVLTKYQDNTTCAVVSKEEIKSIESEKSDTARIRCLLQILKPKEDKHYEAFKQALDITRNGHVLAEIKTPKKSSNQESFQKRLKGTRVGIVKGISNSNSLIKPIPLVKDDGNLSSDINSDDEETSKKEIATSFDPSSIKIDDLSAWLKEVLSKHDSDTDRSVVEKFKAERIDGHVFNDMSEDELKEFIPLFGERKKVLSEWKKIKEEGYSRCTKQDKDDTNPKCVATTENESVQVCHLRKFDRDSSSTSTNYLKNGKLPDLQTRPGNLLSPFHHYFLIEEGSVNIQRNISVISKEVTKFGCACLNERMNGTIHIGVSSNGIIQGMYLSQQNKDLLGRQITDCIMTSFQCHQHSTALNCIRPPQFVEVTCASSETLYVIEVDVVPCSRLVNEQAFFVKSTMAGGQLNSLLRYNNGIFIADPFSVEQFLQTLGSIIDDSFQDADFIVHVPWNAIFDFNARDEINSIQVFLENEHNLAFNTNGVNDFDDCKTESTLLRQTSENLRDSSIPNWIYCNELKIADPSVWRFDQGDSFRKSLDFYSEKLKKIRAELLLHSLMTKTKF